MERVLKKNTKRFWFVLLVLATCIGLAFSLKLNLNLKAEEPATGTYGAFNYKVENGEVIITKYIAKGNTEVSIPATIDGLPVTEIGDSSFSAAGSDLKKIDFGEHSNLKRIGQKAFYNCGLTNLILPDSVTFIGYEAFHDVPLYTVKLPKHLEQIDSYAFEGNHTQRIYIPNFTNDVKINGNIWYHPYDGSDDVHTSFHPNYSTVAVFEEGITKIPDNMFSCLRTLAWAEIPDSVTSIGSHAFVNISNGKCTIVIPNSVTSIGDDAFKETVWPNRKPIIRCYEGSYAEKYSKEHDLFIDTWEGATTFYHPSAEDANGYLITTHDICYYSDSYFSNGDDMLGSYSYNPSLATMSMALAWSTYSDETLINGSAGYRYTSNYANNLLTNIGMVDIKANDDYSTKPTSDSIGVICGNKPIYQDGKQYTLIACAIRGGGYEQEWSSNFAIGTENQHQGFQDSADKVFKFLTNYITNTEYHISGPIKIWITGYSRAAAVSNLLAGKIDEANDPFAADITYDLKDVYTYTFETPAGALQKDVNKDRYGNIFNLINPADPVPYVAPAALGFGRYGVDLYFPAKGINSDYWASKGKMKKIYDNMYSEKEASNSSDYVPKYELVDKFVMKKIKLIAPTIDESDSIKWDKWEAIVETDYNHMKSQPVFLSDLVTIVANDLMVSRENYVEKYQDDIRLLFEIYYSIPKQNLPTVKATFMEHLKKEWSLVVALCLSEKLALGVSDVRGAVENTVSEWLVDSIRAAGLRPESYRTKEAVKTIAHLAEAFVLTHPNYTTSAVMYAEGLKAGHYPQLCYAWVASMDKNYIPDAEVSFHIFDYRKVRINCDVDVSVYDSKHNLVAQIKDEQPVNLDNDYLYGIDDDGQKYVILPIDGSYTMDIKAYNDTVVNYGVSEYSSAAGDYVRDVNFFNVKLKKDASLTAEASSYPQEEIETDNMEASHATYTLETAEGKELPATSDLKDEDSVSAYYNVNATSSNEEHGIVLGSGSHQYGHFAKLEAVSSEDYEFFGWYQDGKLVSRDNPYRFRVESDVEIIGQFEDEKNIVTMKEIDGKWYAVRGDEVASDFTGFLKYDGKLWYAENGKIEFNKTGVFKDPQTGEEYYCLENEVKKNYTGPAPYNGKIWYVEDGKVVTLYQGLYKQNANNWYVMKDGQRDSSYQGAISDNGVLYWVKDGKVNFNENRILWTGKEWLKFTKGKEDRSFQTIGYNDAGFWKCKNGVVDFGYNGISYNEAGFWKCKNGKVDFGYNGIGYNEAGWWKCKGGKVDFGYNGIGYNEAGWWKCSGGKVDFNFTGVGYNDAGWWYCSHGKVDFKYNGLGSNTAGIWVIKGGKVDFNYTGRYRFNNSVFTVRGGKVVS